MKFGGLTPIPVLVLIRLFSVCFWQGGIIPPSTEEDTLAGVELTLTAIKS